MHRTQAQLERSFKTLGKPLPLSLFFRATALQFKGSPLSAIGSINRGGRYNPRHEFEILYLARHPDTAVREIKLVSCDSSGNSVVIPAPPQILFAVECKLQNVIDLSSAADRKTIRVTKSELLRKWQDEIDAGIIPYTHTIGRAARGTGVEALIVPSAQNKHETNVAVIVDRLRVGSYVEIYEATAFGPGVTTKLTGTI